MDCKLFRGVRSALYVNVLEILWWNGHWHEEVQLFDQVAMSVGRKGSSARGEGWAYSKIKSINIESCFMHLSSNWRPRFPKMFWTEEIHEAAMLRSAIRAEFIKALLWTGAVVYSVNDSNLFAKRKCGHGHIVAELNLILLLLKL